MDRVRQLLMRAIFITSLVVVAAIGGVFLHLWLRGSSEAAPARTGGRPPRRQRPALVNEPDGSIYDLNLKQSQLEDRLTLQEQRSRQLQNELAGVQKDRDRLEHDLRTLEADVGRIRRQLARRPETPAANAPPGNTPGPAPPEGGPP